MSSPLIASYRVTMPYSVGGFAHKVHAYAKIGTTTPTIALAIRGGGVPVLWTDCVQAFIRYFTSGFMPATVSWGTSLLETLSGIVWVPVATSSITWAGTGALQPATEATMVLRDTAFKKVRVTALDTNIGAPFRRTSPAGVDALSAAMKEWTADFTDPSAPYLWQVSRSNLNLNASPFVALTVTLNRKLRRARGYV